MKRLMCMGDSITFGDGAGGYRRHLGDMLRASGAEFRFVGAIRSEWGEHEGYPGFSIQDLRLGHDGGEYGVSRPIELTLKEFSPDALLLMLGTNDLYEADPWQSFLKLKALMDAALGERPQMALLVSSILPVVPGPKPWNSTVPEDVITRIPEFNGCIRGYVEAARNYGNRLHFVDVFRSIDSPSELEADGVHPMGPVFKKIAQAWFDALKDAGECLG